MPKLNLLITISTIVIVIIISTIVVTITIKLIFKHKINVVDLINNVNDKANYKICKLK